MNDAKQVVRSGYDSIAARYDKWASSIESPELEWIDELLSRLPAGSDVLDLGCGGGRAPAQRLAASHRYTGVDLSNEQIARARERMPHGRFVVDDAALIELRHESFDAVVSLFMFGHVPRAEQAPLLGRIAGWLRLGGWLLTTMGTCDSDDEIEDDWLGAPMFFASFDPMTNRRLLVEAGFELVCDRVVAQDEPGHGPVSFMWALARRL